jgi:hypothetical protein
MNVGETGASRLINTLNTKKVGERQTLCQSSINFVKNVVFKYYELMKVMPHLAFELFAKLTQLTDLYYFVSFHV